MSGQVFADAPTDPGQDCQGRGNPTKNSGRVNNDSSGADNAVAMAIMQNTSGKRRTLRMMVITVDFLRCFLSVHELMRRAKKK